MTEVLHPGHDSSPATTSDPISDAELIALVRAGDSAAYETLFLRHRDVAIRYARRLSDSERAEDLCAEAFTKILDLLQRGKGPDVAFRAYLLTTVRTSHLNTLRSGNREDLVPDHEPISRMSPVIEDPDDRFDRRAIFRAFSQLPERWQTALWMTAVEGRNHDEVSEHLGIKSNAVASLAFRARAGLRQAYLAEHLLDTTDPRCRTIIEQLPSYLRDRATSRRREQVDEHLRGCITCSTAALELSEVDSQLGALIGPLALVGFTVGTASVAAPAGGLVGLVKGITGTLLTNAKAVGSAAPGLLGAKAAAVVTVTALSVAVGAEVIHQSDPGSRPAPQAEAPVSVEQPVDSPGLVGPTPTSTPTLLSIVVPSPTADVLGPVPALALPSSPTTSAGAASSSPAAPVPSATPTTSSPSPSSAPTTPSETPSVATKQLAIGQASNATYNQNGARWERVYVPVTDPPEGTTLVVTTNRTIQVAKAYTTDTGWSCGNPTTQWVDGSTYASTKIVCSRYTHGNGRVLQFDYNVLPNAKFVAEVIPPHGYDDPSLVDNLVQLLLRG